MTVRILTDAITLLINSVIDLSENQIKPANLIKKIISCVKLPKLPNKNAESASVSFLTCISSH